MNPKGAVFSPDRGYRYQLWRIWTPHKPKVLFIGLNPATAHELHNDPTITRCIGFAQAWGYGGMYMGNLFNLVSSNPIKLLTGLPVEHELGQGLAALFEMGHDSGLVVAAWGRLPYKRLEERASKVISMGNRVLYCLGVNKDGSPKHPLYLKVDTLPILFHPRTEAK